MTPCVAAILRSVGAVLIAMFGFWTATTSAALAERMPAVPAYTYNSPDVPGADARAHLERGPPMGDGTVSVRIAVVDSSPDALARPHPSTSPGAFDYDHPASLEQTARGNSRAAEQVRSTEAGLGVVRPSDVAANGADDATSITTRYSRPSGATTRAQREAVQGQPCVDCGNIAERQVADHIDPLVKEYYRTGTIDLQRMRSLEAVRPQCPTCSARQGALLNRYSIEMRRLLGLE